MTSRFDLAVAGGGIVGSAVAALAALEGRIPADRIVLLEPQEPQAPRSTEPLDVRVSAFTPASLALLERLGVWAKLDAARTAACERMVIWPEHVPATSPDALVFDAAELGEPRLAVIAENRAVQAALLARCRELGLRVLRAGVDHVQFDGSGALLDAEGEQLETGLLVGADGAESAVRAAAGIPVRRGDYGAQGIVASVRAASAQPGTAFQCFLSTGPLALLPLPEGAYSIVWSAADSFARELLAMDEAAFNDALTRASDGVAGNLELTGPRAAFPLRRLSASRYVAPGCALVGDAAHVIHPLAGQGVNQGLLDATALVAALAARPRGEGLSGWRALRRYERERRSGNALMGTVVNTLDGLFSRGHAVPAQLAGFGMGLVGRSAMARRFLFRQAAGDRSSPRR